MIVQGALTDEAEVIDFEPLFDGEDVTEAELKGEEGESLQGDDTATLSRKTKLPMNPKNQKRNLIKNLKR